MRDIVIGGFDQLLLVGAFFQHGDQFADQQAEADGGTLGVYDGQVKIGMILTDTGECDVRRVVGSGDPGRKAQINDTVSGLCIRQESVGKHGGIDVIGLDITLDIVQYLIKFFCLYGLAVQIIHIVDHNRGRNHV